VLRPIRLVRLAATSEGLRLRYFMRRVAVRAALGCVALFLLLDGLVFGHIAVWYSLREYLPRHLTALILTVVDLLLALVLAMIASRSRPGLAEREAKLVRERALDDVVNSLTISALVMRTVEMFTRARR